jgi:hypothetical protein
MTGPSIPGQALPVALNLVLSKSQTGMLRQERPQRIDGVRQMCVITGFIRGAGVSGRLIPARSLGWLR